MYRYFFNRPRPLEVVLNRFDVMERRDNHVDLDNSDMAETDESGIEEDCTEMGICPRELGRKSSMCSQTLREC